MCQREKSEQYLLKKYVVEFYYNQTLKASYTILAKNEIIAYALGCDKLDIKDDWVASIGFEARIQYVDIYKKS